MSEEKYTKLSPEDKQELVVLTSSLVQRSHLAAGLGQQFKGDRDIYNALGYNKTLVYDDYYGVYDRQDIAGRIVDMPASSTWRNTPNVWETDDTEEETPFEQAWTDLADRIKVWHHLERADRLAGIGRYAILVIGTRGDTSLIDPILPNSLSSPDDILYLSPFSEKSAEVASFDVDPSSERFGKPDFYTIDFAGDLATTQVVTKFRVHHSRVLHIAEGLLEDEVYGRPRLRRVMNLFHDLAKVVGGSAEMFWQGAFRGLHADIDKDAEFDPTGPEATQLSDEIDEYIHGLRRYIRTRGMNIQALGGETPNPEGIFEVLLSLVAGASGIPKRILLGAERGELASSQDEINFNSFIAERQVHFAEPLVLRPLIDKLVEWGAIPEPKEPYTIEWPNLFAMSEVEIAEIAHKKATTIQSYVTNPMAEEVMPIPEFRREVLGLEGLSSDEDVAHLEHRMELEDEEEATELDEEFVRKLKERLERDAAAEQAPVDEEEEDEDEEEED